MFLIHILEIGCIPLGFECERKKYKIPKNFVINSSKGEEKCLTIQVQI